MAGKFFNILDDMKEFMSENNRTVLDNKYKMYLEIRYDVEDIEDIINFLKILESSRKRMGFNG